MAKKTIQRHITALKMFHKFLVDENLAYENPMKLIQGVKLDKKFLKYCQLKKLIK